MASFIHFRSEKEEESHIIEVNVKVELKNKLAGLDDFVKVVLLPMGHIKKVSCKASDDYSRLHYSEMRSAFRRLSEENKVLLEGDFMNSSILGTVNLIRKGYLGN